MTTTRLRLVVASLFFVAGCSTTLPPREAIAIPSAFHEPAPAGGTRPSTAWWSMFADPTLDAWIARADAANTTIRDAAARVAKARALAHGADAARWPVLGVSADASRVGGPIINAVGTTGNLVEAGATLRYEVDVLGRAAKLADAASLDVESRDALLQSTRLLVEADTAQTYFSLRALDDERALLRATADSFRETLALVERRRRAGFASDLELARLRAEANATDADALVLDRRRAALEHALAFLAGSTASTVDTATAPQSDTLPIVAADVPSIVLARRPDVFAAARAMDAARARLSVAQTAWFPSFTLSASSGYASSDIGELLRSSARSWGIAGLVAATVLDGGARRAATEGAEADLEAAATAFRERMLAALRDVEDQLSALRILAVQADTLRSAVDAASEGTTRSESLYRNGLVGQLDLPDARRTELRARRAALQARAARYAATVALVRALGGGWGEAPPSNVVASR